MHGQHLRDMMETADVEPTSLGFEHLSQGFKWKPFVQEQD